MDDCIAWFWCCTQHSVCWFSSDSVLLSCPWMRTTSCSERFASHTEPCCLTCVLPAPPSELWERCTFQAPSCREEAGLPFGNSSSTTISPFLRHGGHHKQFSFWLGSVFWVWSDQANPQQVQGHQQSQMYSVAEWEMFACVMKCVGVRAHTGDLFILANLAEPSCDLNRIPCST